MKKLLLLLCSIALLSSCTRTIEYDNCEYVKRGFSISHKGNCKYCAKRDSIKTRELIDKVLLEVFD